MTKASREKKLAFINQFGRRDSGLRVGCSEMLAMHGPAWLSDEQIDDIVNDKIHNWRLSQKLNRENRALRRVKEQDK